MTKSKYYRGWLVLPLIIGMISYVVSLFLGPRIESQRVSGVLLILSLGFMIAAVPYGVTAVVLWRKIPIWKPGLTRIASTFAPWAWIIPATFFASRFQDPERPTPQAGFPWLILVLCTLWICTALVLEKFFVEGDS
jgi:hypothetical protein